MIIQLEESGARICNQDFLNPKPMPKMPSTRLSQSNDVLDVSSAVWQKYGEKRNTLDMISGTKGLQFTRERLAKQKEKERVWTAA